jgi:hypothetical protein
MDVHLLVDKVQCSERDIELAGCEESMSLCSISIKVTGLTLEGCDACRGMITSGVGTGGGGATLLATSWLPMIAMNLFRVSFMAWVASAGLLSRFSICWNLSSSVAVGLTTFNNCYKGGTGGSRL